MLAAEHECLRELRLRALESDPEVFGSTHAGEATRPAGWWLRWAAASEGGVWERTFVLADGEGRWLGMAFACFSADRPGVAWLGGMWIAPQARGRGGARLLCWACIDWSSGRGAEELWLTVLVANELAQRVYTAAGFTVHERILSSRGARTLDELVMRRSL